MAAMRLTYFPSPLVGEGGFAKRRRVRGISPQAQTSPAERYPSSGASRHLLPRGEKEDFLRRSRVAQCGDDVVDHFLDQDAVVALAHDADHGLGAGRTHQQTAVAVEAF